MSLGVVAFWMALGVAIASIKGFTSTNQLFQKPEFTIAVGAVIGTLSTSDPDASNTFTYTLVTGTGSTDNASFTINGSTLTAAAARTIVPRKSGIAQGKRAAK